ncbi:hypothetical protein LTR62_000784 [Meristemomyces frigidus]|uniref:Uncharacterized protein n=1 Tax=Meristemomyces frigidus TaxID=1508187 RepID=A0AAN7YI94_9PEZI|nr:hypothetical protein LTR62_000784 [Meristemomyces frigidus]
MAAYSDHRLGRISQNGSGNTEALPTGCCNYRDLAIGIQAPVCGCKRFWLNNDHYGGQINHCERVWCFCGHHACFHDGSSQSNGLSQLSVGALLGTRASGNATSLRYSTAPVAHQASSLRQPTGLGINATQSIDCRLFDALNAFARDQDDDLPSDNSSKLPSTACPSIIAERRPSPVRVMSERAQQLRAMGPPVHIPQVEVQVGSADEYSATEVATPSIRGTPDLCASAAVGLQPRVSSFRFPAAGPSQRNATGNLGEQRSPRQIPPFPAASRATRASPIVNFSPPGAAAGSVVEMENVLRTLSRRVEVLEGMSFSQVPVEEVHERFEHMDSRVLDLEVWRTHSESERVEQQSAEASQSKRRRLLPSEDSSFSSEGSAFDSAAAAQTDTIVLATLAANAETVPRIDALERRVGELEHASLPSFGRPWHVQVVLLPWGSALRGIWFSAQEATQNSHRHGTQVSDEWSMAQPTLKLPFTSADSGAWTTESIQAWAKNTHNWLSPKACGPNGTVFHRLASRGLVQDVVVTGSDSGHILNAIKAAFHPILADHAHNDETDTIANALSEPYIPLRKVRKSSRLRFLSPAEMVTSASWTAGFLDDSVCMKVTDGPRRLYLTTPEAYLQNQESGYTWAQVRHLPLYDADADEHAAQATNAAIEECWTYNDHLDRSISAAASFAGSRTSEQYHGPDASPQLPPGMVEIDSAYNDRGTGVARHQRTTSLPVSDSVVSSNRVVLPKRRVASFETSSKSTHHEAGLPASAFYKRRRISFSPEAERKGVGLTPRPSREPTSPFTTSEQAGDVLSQAEKDGSSLHHHVRGATPFAYATPHSNSNAYGRVEHGTVPVFPCGDTEPDTELGAPQSEGMEDEWEGVGDGAEMDVDVLHNNAGTMATGHGHESEEEDDGQLDDEQEDL